MASFLTLSPLPPPIPPGTYVAKVVAATERVSEAGNDLIAMKLTLPDGRTLPCCLTFVPQARPVPNAFAASAGFLVPKELDVEVQLTAELCKGRYIYITVTADQDSNGESAPRVSRFLTREAALLANPALAKVALQPQEPIRLPVIPRTPNLSNKTSHGGDPCLRSLQKDSGTGAQYCDSAVRSPPAYSWRGNLFRNNHRPAGRPANTSALHRPGNRMRAQSSSR